MELIRSLQSEFLKIKGSRIPVITIFGGLLMSLVFTGRYIFIENHINLTNDPEIWQSLFSQNSRAFLGFIIPIGAMLICALIAQIEYSNNNWKQVHTTPQRLSTIFFAKFTVLIIFTIFVFIMLNVGILMHGILPCLVIGGSFPNHPIPFEHFFFETVKCFILTLPIIAFQYLLSLQYKNFMVSIGIGLTVYVGTMPGIKMGDISLLSPYRYVLNYFDQITTPRDLWLALGYFGLLSILSYLLYVKKGEKG